MDKPDEQSAHPNAAGPAVASILAVIVAMAISTPARAEYRCSTPWLLTLWEKRACELARQDTPDALIRYVHGINKVSAGLNIDDYVGKADAERWELARQNPHPEASASAAANSPAKGTEKAN